MGVIIFGEQLTTANIFDITLIIIAVTLIIAAKPLASHIKTVLNKK